MASTDYLDDLRFCPDCGQPTTSPLRTWGNAVCENTSPKAECKPLSSRNFCGRCGKADPGAKCIGCENAKRRWYQLEPSPAANEFYGGMKWFFANFSILEMPLILLCGVPIVVYILWMYVEVLQFWSKSPMVYLAIFSAIAVASAATYGLCRVLFYQLYCSAKALIAPMPRPPKSWDALSGLPIARVVNAKPDCSKKHQYSDWAGLLLGALLVLHIPAIVPLVGEAMMSQETRERIKQHEAERAKRPIN